MAAKSIKINGKEYAYAELNEAAKNMIGNIEVAEKKMAQLKQEIVLCQVARETFAKTLMANLPVLEADKV